MITMTLNDACSLVTDGTHDTPKRVAEGFPLVKAKEISRGRIDFETCDQISYEDHIKVISRSKPEQGDTLFVHIGASLGESAFVYTHKEFSIKNVALFKPNPAKVDCRYLYYYIIGSRFQNEIKAIKTGAAQPFVGLATLRNHSIVVHRNLETQRKIAFILSAYDDLIENNTRRIKILEAMAQAIYCEWFVNFRFPGHEKVKMVDSPLGTIPEGWAVGRLDDALVLQRGFDLPKKQRDDSGDVPIYAATGHNGTHNESKVKAPGVLTGRSGSLGTVQYINEDFWPLNTTLWVKEFKLATPLFAYYVLSGLELEKFNSGAAVPTLNRNDVHGLPTLLPPAPILEIFDRHILPMFQLKNTLSKKNKNLRQARDLLLPTLISGAMDVSEIEIEVKENVA